MHAIQQNFNILIFLQSNCNRVTASGPEIGWSIHDRMKLGLQAQITNQVSMKLIENEEKLCTLKLPTREVCEPIWNAVTSPVCTSILGLPITTILDTSTQSQRIVIPTSVTDASNLYIVARNF